MRGPVSTVTQIGPLERIVAIGGRGFQALTDGGIGVRDMGRWSDFEERAVSVSARMPCCSAKSLSHDILRRIRGMEGFVEGGHMVVLIHCQGHVGFVIMRISS